MGSREEIFEKLRANTAATYDYPDLGPLESEALTFSDRAAAFCESLTEAGGRAVTAPAGTASEDLAAFVARTLSVEYPGARSVVTAPGVDLSGLLPEEVKLSAVGDFQSPEALDGSDVAVVRARFGVAENGAVWIDDFGKYRALLFIAEALAALFWNFHLRSFQDCRHRAGAGVRSTRSPQRDRSARIAVALPECGDG